MTLWLWLDDTNYFHKLNESVDVYWVVHMRQMAVAESQMCFGMGCGGQSYVCGWRLSMACGEWRQEPVHEVMSQSFIFPFAHCLLISLTEAM